MCCSFSFLFSFDFNLEIAVEVNEVGGGVDGTVGEAVELTELAVEVLYITSFAPNTDPVVNSNPLV